MAVVSDQPPIDLREPGGWRRSKDQIATGLMWLAFVIILIPLGLYAVRLDPAIASGVFVTMCTDCVGFFAFLGLAAIWLV